MPDPALPVRPLSLGAALLLAPLAAHAQEGTCAGAPAGTRLRLEVTHIRAAEGKVVMTVYPDDAGRFLAPKGKLARLRLPAKAPVTPGCFELPGPGRYAVAVYHDSNGNDRFDRTLVGLPAEGYGFSNDVPTPTGLPPFEAVRFTVKAGETTVKIAMRYPR
jgi:uncharacterized protein (DUF2141 family)